MANLLFHERFWPHCKLDLVISVSYAVYFRGYRGNSSWICLILSHHEEHEDHKEKNINLILSFRVLRGLRGYGCLT
jgi:hypothetical protein